jgi:phosphatidate phosphatase APP1
MIALGESARPADSASSKIAQQPAATSPARHAEKSAADSESYGAVRGLGFSPENAQAGFHLIPPAVSGEGQAVQVASRTYMPHTMTLVVDIDETLCVTDYTNVFWGIGRDDSRPLPNAARIMNSLSRDFRIVYLTARPRNLLEKTRRWIAREGFPQGDIITAPNVLDLISQTTYKQKQLNRMRASYPNMLIGIGDKPTDADAYRKHGMLPVVVNPWRDRHYRAGELIMQDWQQLGEFFERNRDVLTDRPLLAEAMQTRGSLPLMLSDR